METRFKIKIDRYHWSCGDGCCSDSGFKIECLDFANDQVRVVYENSEWEHHRKWGSLFDRAIEEISKIVPDPIEDVDYYLYFVGTEETRDKETGEYDILEYDEDSRWLK